MKLFFDILTCFFAAIGIAAIIAAIYRRAGRKYKNRLRGTYIYIPHESETSDSIKEKISQGCEPEAGDMLILVRSEREREDVLNDICRKYGRIFVINSPKPLTELLADEACDGRNE